MVLESKNALLDLILPFTILAFITLIYVINKQSKQFVKFFHVIVIPLVGVLTAKKTISQDIDQHYINESFASWLVLMIFGGFSSSMQWYQSVAINVLCFFGYIAIVVNQYGLKGIGNDAYVHLVTAIIFSAALIKMNEENLRHSFNLLSVSKIEEMKW
jgi:hypothetical protein